MVETRSYSIKSKQQTNGLWKPSFFNHNFGSVAFLVHEDDTGVLGQLSSYDESSVYERETILLT